MKYTLALITYEREKENYIWDTLASLEEAGVFESDLYGGMVISDAGSSKEYKDKLKEFAKKHKDVVVKTTRTRLYPRFNGSKALIEASKLGNEEIIFFEDDVKVIPNFLKVLDDWISFFAEDNVEFYPLGAAYTKSIKESKGAWKYPVKAFYGTQCYVTSNEVAKDWGKYLGDITKGHLEGEGAKKQCHDLHLKAYAKEMGHKDYFITPAPHSFVQHIGKESSLHPGRFHDYPFQEDKVDTAFDLSYQEEREGKYTSKNLVELLASYLPKEDAVYDFGCGTGEYIAELKKKGFKVQGFDATKGIQKYEDVIQADITSAIHVPETGSVICLEVLEHIAKDNEEKAVDNLIRATKEHLIVSWAKKGQGGKGHINEQDWEYVVNLFKSKGFTYERNLSLDWRAKAGKDLKWFADTLFVFKKV